MLDGFWDLGHLEIATRILPLKIHGDFLARVSLIYLDPVRFDTEYIMFSVITCVLILLNRLRSLFLKSVDDHWLQALSSRAQSEQDATDQDDEGC